ncbi:MAG: hypothetical protein HKN52_00925 [Eudoraea sp.]|nr:hypothetical protein [Eudoraea sp.]
MKTEMEDIDKMIREALTEEEAKFYEDLNEPSIFEKLGEVYKGRQGWLAMVMNIVILLLFALFIYSLIQFLNTTQIQELVRWASVGLFSILALSIMKIYFWMQMDKNDLKRELKRIELQIAVLSGKLEK